MAKPQIGSKRLLIDKANATMLVTIGVTAFIVVFSLVAVKALFSQSGYQSRVLKEKQLALKQLKQNNSSVASLVESYKAFANEPQNVLGGNPAGTSSIDGDNPKITLDALPSKYDFPGLISSMEKLLKDGGYQIDSLGGVDDEVAQQNTATDQPQPIEMPFPFSIKTGSETSAKNLFVLLEKSIRPIDVTSVSIAVEQTGMKISVNAKTYYQPEKDLKITTKVVK